MSRDDTLGGGETDSSSYENDRNQNELFNAEFLERTPEGELILKFRKDPGDVDLLHAALKENKDGTYTVQFPKKSVKFVEAEDEETEGSSDPEKAEMTESSLRVQQQPRIQSPDPLTPFSPDFPRTPVTPSTANSTTCLTRPDRTS
jgi:hypothetical protein